LRFINAKMRDDHDSAVQAVIVRKNSNDNLQR
jgi:hypothetical protein